MSDIYKKLGIPDPLLLDADGSGKLLPQSKPDQIIGPGAALTAKIVSAHQSELARLKAENLTQAEEIRRLREVLEYYTNPEIYEDTREGVDWPDYEWPEFPVIKDQGDTARKALTPTPTTWGTKALDVVEAAEKAPHDEKCDTRLNIAMLHYRDGIEGPMPCNCWKAALSELQKEKGNN